MGLDMYLRVERRFDPLSPAAVAVLNAAGTTAIELEALAGLDPREHEPYLYLARWDWYPDEDKDKANRVFQAAGISQLGTQESPSGQLVWRDGKVVVQLTCIYWRKANQIHRWFVENCQNGIDECQEAEVHPEQLAQLKDLCAKELAACGKGQGGKILPPRAGFFFGGTDIDEWYIRELRETVDDIDRVVKEAARIGGITFSYQSSW